MEKIKATHFEIFNPLSIFFKQKLEEFSLSYTKPTNKERDVLINEIVEYLNKEKIVSGKHEKINGKMVGMKIFRISKN